MNKRNHCGLGVIKSLGENINSLAEFGKYITTARHAAADHAGQPDVQRLRALFAP
jgi:hypothetical protein